MKKIAKGLVYENSFGELVTSSDKVAKMLGARHSDFLRNLNTFIGTLECVKSDTNSGAFYVQTFSTATFEFRETILTNRMGAEFTVYEINKWGFMKMLTLVQRYSKANTMVNEFIDAFATLEEFYHRTIRENKAELGLPINLFDGAWN